MQLAGSRLVVIGIANSIDMVDRTLPELKERGVAPTCILFSGYSAQQAAEIVQQRLQTLPGPVFKTNAIFAACRKVRSRFSRGGLCCSPQLRHQDNPLCSSSCKANARCQRLAGILPDLMGMQQEHEAIHRFIAVAVGDPTHSCQLVQVVRRTALFFGET